MGGCHGPGRIMLLGYFSVAGPGINLNEFPFQQEKKIEIYSIYDIQIFKKTARV